MKKVLSIVLAAVMVLCVMPISGLAANYTPATGYTAYDSDKVSANDTDYIASLSVDQIAGIVLDYADAYLAGVDVNVNYQGFEINTADMFDINTLTNWAYQAIEGDQLGGDFDKLDASALNGLSRAGGDINYIYGIITFISDNADYFGKVFSWDNPDQTFDCGKIGEYLMTLNEGDEGYEAREFYEDYILSNDIQKAFVNEIAREMDYTIPEGETFDETISHGIINWVAALFEDAGLLSDEGIKALKTYDLRTEDIYYHLKNLVSLLQSDNEVAEKTYFTYYLDSLIRTALKTALGYTPTVSETSASSNVVAEFKTVYTDLATLYSISGGTVNYRAADGKYYQFVVTAGGVTSAKELTWENALGFNFEMPVVSIMTGANDVLVKEYKPSSTNEEDYKPTLYMGATYASSVPEELKTAVNVSTEAVPEAFANVISTATPLSMQDYIKVLVKQGEETKLNTTISFAEVEAYAEQEALKMAKETAAGVTLPFGLTVDVESVDITLNYTGYATDDEFICVVDAAATATLSGTGATFAQSTVDSIIASTITNPIATIVIDNLSGTDTDISAIADLANFIDTDFAVDMSVLDFAGNYDAYNGVIGQVNRVLCDLLDMLLTDEGYEDLALTEGGNENLTANLEKLCEKADSVLKAAKSVISGDEFKALVDSMNISDIFASSHGFNADMIYNLDFSSVENLYVCAIRLGCDFLDDEQPGVLHDIHMLVEDLETLDAMAVAVTDYALEKAIAKANADIADFDYEYTPFGTVNNDVDAKNVIMTKAVDLIYYTVNDWGVSKVNAILNNCINKLNSEIGETLIPNVDFKLGVEKADTWEDTLNALVDRILELTDGIIVCVSGIDRNANVFDKIGTVANAILPMGSLASNCAGNGYVFDVKHIVNDIVFDEVLAGDFDDFLRLFETSVKTNDVAQGVSVTYALIKASDHIVDAVFPGTVAAELYTPSLTVQEEFTGSLSDKNIAARNMVSLNSVKGSFIPAVLELIRESEILPELVFADCQHTNTMNVDAVPATCILSGYTAGIRCKDCGKWVSGHEETNENFVHVGEFETVKEVEPTCTEDGTTEGTKCLACGKIVDGCKKIDATGHSESGWKTDKAATCTVDGSKHTECTECGETLKTEIITATGHKYGEWKVEKSSTCTVQGYEARYCGCGDKETRDLPLASHKPVVNPGYDATCKEDGRTDGTICSVCKTEIESQQVIPAKGHTDADGDNTCDECGATIKEPSFIDKIKAFFQSIIDWFKNLFK